MTRSLQVREAAKSADRKILTEQTYSTQRSYGVGRARRVADLRVRLLVTTDWTARHRRRIPRSQRTSRSVEKFQHAGYEPAVIAAQRVIDLLTLRYRQPPRRQLNSRSMTSAPRRLSRRRT
jgi:hypothetical protein